MRVYISSHDRWAALYVGGLLTAAGHAVRSTWHDGPVARSAALTPEDRADIAERNLDLIADSDALVLIAAPDQVPGGKFVEAGYALASGAAVFILGRRENILLHTPDIRAFDDPAEMIAALATDSGEIPR